MALIPQRELERFFAEVGPRLDTAQTLDDELDRQLARRFNVFRYLRTDEMGFSRMIADLLDPAGDHGQGVAFLKLLTERLDFAKDVNLSDLGNATVQTERLIDGRRRIDIVVEVDSKHCLAIENKSNFAGDQEDQVKDYLDWLKRQYRHSLLVYLSPTGEGPSEDSVPREVIEDLETKANQRFVVMPCGPSNASNSGFSLVDWLANCRRICDVDRFRWYLREAETYCKQRYGGSVVTDSKKSAVAKFIYGNTTNVATALAVAETWPEVAREIKSEFLKLISRHLRLGSSWRQQGALPWDNLPDDILYDQGYGQKRYESYIYICRESWQPYVVDGKKRYTVIRMHADSKDDRDWVIGVSSPAANRVSEDDRARCEQLHEELGKLDMRQSGWPCWEYVDEKYRDWNPLIPKMHEELQLGSGEVGEITDYFVGKFKKFADRVIPIIDRINGN